jgi:hypothetical protein
MHSWSEPIILKKNQMSQNKHFSWHILESLLIRTYITAMDHTNTNPETIKHNLCLARRAWREIKNKGLTSDKQSYKKKPMNTLVNRI